MRLHLAAFLVALFVAPAAMVAQSVEATPDQAAKLDDALTKTINHGADLFNDQADYAGCYRVFEGALLSIRPFATSDRQKEIDDALLKSARMARYEDKAYALRSILDLVRKDLRRQAGSKAGAATMKETKATTPHVKTQQKKPADGAEPPKNSTSPAIPLPEKLSEPVKTSQDLRQGRFRLAPTASSFGLRSRRPLRLASETKQPPVFSSGLVRKNNHSS